MDDATLRNASNRGAIYSRDRSSAADGADRTIMANHLKHQGQTPVELGCKRQLAVAWLLPGAICLATVGEPSCPDSRPQILRLTGL